MSPSDRSDRSFRRRTARTLSILAPLLCASLLCAGIAGAGGSAVDGSRQGVDEVLTLEEAAAFLEIEPDLVAALAEDGTLPGRKLGSHWRFSRSRLLTWLAADDARAIADEPEPLSGTELEDMRAAGRGGPGAPSGSTPDGAEPEADAEGEARVETVGEAPRDTSATDIFLRSRRVLLAPKQIVIEPLLFYTRADTPDIQFQSFSSSDGLPISAAVGKAANIEQNITTASLTGRIGLAEGLELNSGLTFQDRRIQAESEPEEVDTALRSIFLGLRKTVLREAGHRPELVVGVQGIGPLGDSSPAVATSLFAIKSADPVAMFTGIEYQHTFSRDFDEARKLEPEDTFGAQLGYVFAVTDETSLNSSVQGLFVLSSSFDAGKVHSNEQFSLRLGVTQRLSSDLYVEPSVAFGLNGPGDFVTFGLRFPWIAYP